MGNKKDLSQDITKINPQVGGLPVPDFMAGETDFGTAGMDGFIIPPRLKIVQKQASADLLNKYAPGDVILTPTMAVVVEQPRDEKGRIIEDDIVPFKIVPIFFFPEWVTWNPLEVRGKEPAIRERSVDPTSIVAQKARNPKLRLEDYPGDTTGKLKLRHTEHLNFAVMLYKHPLGVEPAILTFSRGEHSIGSKFASLVRMRKAPLYGCVFDVKVAPRSNALGSWYGFDVMNPESDPWVTAEDYTTFKALHERFAKAHEVGQLKTDLSDEDRPADSAATAPARDDF